jgi:hypothetical protein
VVIGSCGTSGTDSGVDWVCEIAVEVALEAMLDAGRIRPLEPAEPLDHATLRRCSHIVGLMGHEPIAAALDTGADLVLPGRSTDTALSAALPLMRRLPPGPVWHAAKVA